MSDNWTQLRSLNNATGNKTSSTTYLMWIITSSLSHIFDIFKLNFIFCLADSCLVSFKNDLFLIGGSRSWYRYADEPSKVWVLFNDRRGSQHWRDDIIPPLMGSRMWHACSIATLNRKVMSIPI